MFVQPPHHPHYELTVASRMQTPKQGRNKMGDAAVTASNTLPHNQVRGDWPPTVGIAPTTGSAPTLNAPATTFTPNSQRICGAPPHVCRGRSVSHVGWPVLSPMGLDATQLSILYGLRAYLMLRSAETQVASLDSYLAEGRHARSDVLDVISLSANNHLQGIADRLYNIERFADVVCLYRGDPQLHDVWSRLETTTLEISCPHSSQETSSAILYLHNIRAHLIWQASNKHLIVTVQSPASTETPRAAAPKLELLPITLSYAR
jgi:hypothetical protein